MGDDRAEIAQLVAEHHQAVYGYAYRLTGSAADAEDLTQQVFLQAQQKLEQLRSRDAARSWLFTILRHFFLKECEKRQPVAAGNLRIEIDHLPAATAEVPPVDRAELQAALDELPVHYRVVVTMFYYEDCSYREIAERLELPIGTVMSRLARAKEHLRARLFRTEDGKEAGCRTGTAHERG